MLPTIGKQICQAMWGAIVAKKKHKLTKQDEYHLNNVITLTDAIIEQMDGYLRLEIGIALSMVTSIRADGVPSREDWPEAILKLAELFTSCREPEQQSPGSNFNAQA